MKRKIDILPVQPNLIIKAEDYQQINAQIDGISYFYRFSVKDGNEMGVQAVPDARTDLMFGIGAHGVDTYIGGTVLQAKEWEMRSDKTYFGICFQPGKELFPKGMTISDVVNADIAVENQDLSGNIAEKIALETDFKKQTEIFSEYYKRVKLQREEQESTVREIETFMRKKIYESAGMISVKELATQSGYSECYIRRCFEAVHGISPKAFGKFYRFQRMLNYIHDEASSAQMEELALECGYYDQSHMMKDFKKFAGMTPETYRKEIMEHKL